MGRRNKLSRRIKDQIIPDSIVLTPISNNFRASMKCKSSDSYQSRNEVLRAMGFDSYKEYLASDLWRSIRNSVLMRDRGRCRLCGRDASQVHHQRYDHDTLAGMDLDHLISVCGACHKKVEFKGAKKRSFYSARASAESRIEKANAASELHDALDCEYEQLKG